MTEVKVWRIEIVIDEHTERTRAKARLTTPETTLVGLGLARLSPDDTNVPEIGDELAVSRALADLAHQLLEKSASDIEGITHIPAHLTR